MYHSKVVPIFSKTIYIDHHFKNLNIETLIFVVFAELREPHLRIYDHMQGEFRRPNEAISFEIGSAKPNILFIITTLRYSPLVNVKVNMSGYKNRLEFQWISG